MRLVGLATVISIIFGGIVFASSNFYTSNPVYSVSDRQKIQSVSSFKENYIKTRSFNRNDAASLVKMQNSANMFSKDPFERMVAKKGPPLTAEEAKKLILNQVSSAPTSGANVTEKKLNFATNKNPPIPDFLQDFAKSSRPGIDLVSSGGASTSSSTSGTSSGSSSSGTSSLNYTGTSSGSTSQSSTTSTGTSNDSSNSSSSTTNSTVNYGY